MMAALNAESVEILEEIEEMIRAVAFVCYEQLLLTEHRAVLWMTLLRLGRNELPDAQQSETGTM